MSEPWQWPLLLRPVAFHYEGKQGACAGGADCSEAVLGVGTPVIWFAALAALLALIVWYVATRDWRAGAVLLSYAVGWLPWFYFAIAYNRTMFLFYAIPMVPFMVLAITLCAGLADRPGGEDAGGRLPAQAHARGRRRRRVRPAGIDQLLVAASGTVSRTDPLRRVEGQDAVQQPMDLTPITIRQIVVS